MHAAPVARAEHASSLLFGERIAELAVEDVLAVFEDVPSTEVPTADVDPHGIGLVDLLARVQLAPSKSEARRLVQSGGVYVNNRRASDPQARLIPASLESSNVNTSLTLIDMIEASRSWDMQLQLVTSARDMDTSAADLMRLPS